MSSAWNSKRPLRVIYLKRKRYTLIGNQLILKSVTYRDAKRSQWGIKLSKIVKLSWSRIIIRKGLPWTKKSKSKSKIDSNFRFKFSVKLHILDSIGKILTKQTNETVVKNEEEKNQRTCKTQKNHSKLQQKTAESHLHKIDKSTWYFNQIQKILCN